MVSQNCLLLFLISVIVQWLVDVCILYVSGEVSAISIFILEKPGWIKKKKKKAVIMKIPLFDFLQS